MRDFCIFIMYTFCSLCIFVFTGEGDLWGWAQALWLLGQEWWVQKESRMVSFFSPTRISFGSKYITFWRSRFNLLPDRMLVSCPVSCNQCKNKCDDNNVYCKVDIKQILECFAFSDCLSQIGLHLFQSSGLGKVGGVQEEPGLHEHLLL